MGEIVAIAAKPLKIGEGVITSVVIDVMRDEDAKVFYFALAADRHYFRTKHYAAICGVATLPVSVLLTDEQVLVFPDHETCLVAEKVPVLRF